jgi:hypothetical protein
VESLWAAVQGVIPTIRCIEDYMPHPEVLTLIFYNMLIDKELEQIMWGFSYEELKEEEWLRYRKCKRDDWPQWELNEEFIYQPNIGKILDSITYGRLLPCVKAFYAVVGFRLPETLTAIVKRTIACRTHCRNVESHLRGEGYYEWANVMKYILYSVE